MGECDIQGVGFHNNRTAWAAFKSIEGKIRCKYFTVKKFLTAGVTFQQACNKARECAVKARQQMDAETANNVELFQSGVTGVNWDKKNRQWKAVMHIDGKDFVKCFRPKDNSQTEIEAARLAAIAHRAELERKYTTVP